MGTYRFAVVTRLDEKLLDAHRRYDQMLSADPLEWDSLDLFRAICFGVVNKFETDIEVAELIVDQ